MSIISEKFNSEIKTLKSDFEVNKDVMHQGIKGGLNESELSSLIREVIPQRYRITKGIIENAKSEQSNEVDIFIYDDEILPVYIKSDLAFVPVEAVKYVFEVKSKLNATELKTTISKFENFKLIGGRSPTVLFSFSSDIHGSELSRYKKKDINFFTNPAITVLCASNKSYYYKETEEHYLKDHCSVKEFIKILNEAVGFNVEDPVNLLSELMKDNQALNKINRSQFALLISASIQVKNLTRNFDDHKLTVNGIEYSDIKFKIHKWIGIESHDNNVELSFLSGISNTLSKGNFGNYLLNRKGLEAKVFSICYEDTWGNLSCQDFAEEGLKYDPDVVSFSFETSSDANKIIFEIKR